MGALWPAFPLLALFLGAPQARADPQTQSKTPEQSSDAQEGSSNAKAKSSEPDEKPVFYETTTVTARPVSGASGAVTVVSSDELATSEARSGTDVLREVPGLNLLASSGRAGVANAWIRGADPNFTLVLLDGIPLNDSTELQGGAVNLEEISAELVGHAEVVRGPLTSFYGPNSLSGVVQLFTPRGGPGPLRAMAGLNGGNADLRHGFARASGAAGAGGWSAGVAYDEEKHRIAQDGFRQLDGFATADVALGTSALLSLTGRAATGEQDDYPESSGGPVYGTGETRHTDHDDLALGARLQLGEAPEHRQQLTVGVARRALDRTSPAIVPEVPESVEHTTFTRLRVAWQMPLPVDARTTVDVGASGEGEWGVNRSVLKLPPELGRDVPGDYEKSRASGGAFGAFRQQRGPFLYEVALRADVASSDTLQLHPHAGVVWRTASGRTRVRASAGRASKLPSFYALASPRALAGNPDLKPERTVGGEAGIEQSLFGSRVELGVTAFLHEYRDLIDFDPDLFQLVNRAKVRTRGFELTGEWRVRSSLTVAGEATYVDARDFSGGAPLLYEPRWLGAGRVTWKRERLSLQLEARGVSHYLDRQIPVPDRDTVDGYGLVGFAGSCRLGRGLVVRARLDNVTDRSYETLIGFPGPGLSVRAGLGWER